MPETYTCVSCTLVQSIENPACEMCGSWNMNIFSEEDISQFEAPSSMNLAAINGVVPCSFCGCENIGYNIQNCRDCNRFLRFNNESYQRFSSDTNDDYEKYQITMQPQNVTTLPTSTVHQRQNPAGNSEQPLSQDELIALFNRYILIMINETSKPKIFTEKQLRKYLTDLFRSCEEKYFKIDGELTSSTCQICCADDQILVLMKNCRHQIVCQDDFSQYISTCIRDGNILPWIRCPAANCPYPCHVENILKDARLTYEELLSFLKNFMLKKLSRDANFVRCTNCESGGFLQVGIPRKQSVVCRLCDKEQTIKKGSRSKLDSTFQEMIRSGQLRECPACRHLTFKEKGICNIIQCVKCAIWWNWRTNEQGFSQADLKHAARIANTLWEPGELEYQLNLEKNNPKEFRALLERHGMEYDPNYVRGDWED